MRSVRRHVAVSTKRIVLLTVATLFVGILVGVCTASWYLGRILDSSLLSSIEAHLALNGLALDKLSNGDVAGATSMLQSNIDAGLGSMSIMLDDGAKIDTGMRKTLVRIGAARKRQGYVPTDPEIQRISDKLMELHSEVKP